MNIRGVSAYKSVQQSLPAQPRDPVEKQEKSAKPNDPSDADARERLLKMLETKGRIVDIRI